MRIFQQKGQMQTGLALLQGAKSEDTSLYRRTSRCTKSQNHFTLESTKRCLPHTNEHPFPGSMAMLSVLQRVLDFGFSFFLTCFIIRKKKYYW